MKVFALTEYGKRMARKINNPDTPAYRVLHCLDKIHTGTAEQIASYTGLSISQVGSALSDLARYNPPLVGTM